MYPDKYNHYKMKQLDKTAYGINNVFNMTGDKTPMFITGGRNGK